VTGYKEQVREKERQIDALYKQNGKLNLMLGACVITQFSAIHFLKFFLFIFLYELTGKSFLKKTCFAVDF